MRARSSHRSRTSARPHAWVVKRSRSGCSSSGGRGWAPTGPVAPPGRAELRQSRQARLEEVQGPSQGGFQGACVFNKLPRRIGAAAKKSARRSSTLTEH